MPHIRAAIAQLAFLHVSEAFRAAGVGSRLSADLELVARHPGDTEIVVSATPSENTVRFYLGRGYQPMARPLAGAPRAGARGRPHGEGDLNHCSVWRGGVGSVRRRVATHRAAWDGRAVRMISNSPWPLVSVDSALRSGDESSARYTGKRSRIHTVLSALSIGCAGLPGGALATCHLCVRENSAFCDAAGVSSSGSSRPGDSSGADPSAARAVCLVVRKPLLVVVECALSLTRRACPLYPGAEFSRCG